MKTHPKQIVALQITYHDAAEGCGTQAIAAIDAFEVVRDNIGYGARFRKYHAEYAADPDNVAANNALRGLIDKQTHLVCAMWTPDDVPGMDWTDMEQVKKVYPIAEEWRHQTVSILRIASVDQSGNDTIFSLVEPTEIPETIWFTWMASYCKPSDNKKLTAAYDAWHMMEQLQPEPF